MSEKNFDRLVLDLEIYDNQNQFTLAGKIDNKDFLPLVEPLNTEEEVIKYVSKLLKREIKNSDIFKIDINKGLIFLGLSIKEKPEVKGFYWIDYNKAGKAYNNSIGLRDLLINMNKFA